MNDANMKSADISRRVWRAVRILRRFTIPDIMRVVSGVSENRIRKVVIQLINFKAVERLPFRGGRAGDYQGYRIVKDTGPDFPDPRAIEEKNKKEKKERDRKKEPWTPPPPAEPEVLTEEERKARRVIPEDVRKRIEEQWK